MFTIWAILMAIILTGAKGYTGMCPIPNITDNINYIVAEPEEFTMIEVARTTFGTTEPMLLTVVLHYTDERPTTKPAVCRSNSSIEWIMEHTRLVFKVDKPYFRGESGRKWSKVELYI